MRRSPRGRDEVRERAAAQGGLAMAAGWLTGARDGDRLLIEAGGAWTLDELARLDAARRAAARGGRGRRRTRAHRPRGARRPRHRGRLAAAPARASACRVSAGRSSSPACAPTRRRCWPRSGGSSRSRRRRLRRSTRSCALLAELGRSTLAVGDEAARLLSFYGQTVLTLVAGLPAADPAAADLAHPPPRADLRQRPADRRPDRLPDRGRHGLSGRRPAAALRRRDLHGRPARASRSCARSASC